MMCCRVVVLPEKAKPNAPLICIFGMRALSTLLSKVGVIPPLFNEEVVTHKGRTLHAFSLFFLIFFFFLIWLISQEKIFLFLWEIVGHIFIYVNLMYKE